MLNTNKILKGHDLFKNKNYFIMSEKRFMIPVAA